MNLKNIILLGLSISPLLFPVMVMSSCSKNEEEIRAEDDNTQEDEDNDEVILKLSVDNISVDAAGGQEIIQLTANTDWYIENPTSQNGWCDISPVSGKSGTTSLSINVQANGYDKREYVFNIKSKDEEALLTIVQKQLGFFQFILTGTNGNIFYDEGGICNVLATTSLEYDIEYTDNGGEWISRTPTKALTQETISFTISEYTGNTQRECDIIFKERGGELKDTVHIIQYHDKIIEFEDNNFKHYCLTQYDTNNDGEITKREVINVAFVFFSSLNPVSSLRGIEEFENLMSLHCNGVGISELDLSKNSKLSSLECDDNNLLSLDLSNNNDLTHLSCDNNNLTELTLADQNWLSLSCSNNLLISLGSPHNPIKTSSLYCDGNKLENLYITGGSYVDCDDNNLNNIDLSSCPNLTSLDCKHNNLRELDIRNNHKLTNLYCDYNELDRIYIPDYNLLSYLSVDNNNLTGIDLSNCLYINNLSVSRNNIPNLDVSECSNLTHLYCTNNPLQSITISSIQENAEWMSSSYGGIKYWYPDIEIIVK